MAQYYSSVATDFRHFAFMDTSNNYDTFDIYDIYPIFNDEVFPGLQGNFTFSATIISRNDPEEFLSDRDPYDEYIIAGAITGFDSLGTPGSGTIEAFVRTQFGSPLYYLIGCSIDASLYEEAVLSSDAADDLALWITGLRGNDSFKLAPLPTMPRAMPAMTQSMAETGPIRFLVTPGPTGFSARQVLTSFSVV